MKPAETEILLESGTNELEILEFSVGGNHYGINVAKVRELLQYQPIQQMPHAQPSVEGVICPRNELLTVIDLAAYLGHPPSERTKHDIFIVTEFNQSHAAFHVHQVMGIHRISWELIEKPDSAVFGGEDGVVTGVAKLSGNLISILDFEKIMADINPNISAEENASLIDSPDQPDSSHRILVAEDPK
jgi:two-component system chemotaxis response regulator CheV